MNLITLGGGLDINMVINGAQPTFAATASVVLTPGAALA